MKRNLIIISGLLLGSIYAGTASAQQAALVSDQNPRYKESQDRYIKVADSINLQQGTTVQNTYKAYDWYEAKLERRRQNREWRHQERLYNGYSSDFSFGFGSNYLFSPYSSHRYNYGNYYGNYGNYYGRRNNVWFGW